MLYPALLLLMRTTRLLVVDWTDAPADLNGLVRFAERLNLVSARVPSRFKRSLLSWILKTIRVGSLVVLVAVLRLTNYRSLSVKVIPNVMRVPFSNTFKNRHIYALKEICFSPLKTGKKLKILFYPMPSDFRKRIALWKVPRPRPFVLLVRDTCIWKWAWSFDGMILTEETEVLGENLVLLPICPPQIWNGLTWDRIRTSAVRGRWLTSSALKTDIGFNYI